MRFYEQALKRSRIGDRRTPVDFSGLQVESGSLPGCPRYPDFEESSLVISDSDPAEREAVVVIVNPRVSGSFLDPSVKDEEYLREMKEEEEKALRNSRYTGVYLLPRK
ncbi:hypothetical protein [Haloferula sp. BvORR071]|uniref:hypothetical protein n=1 Tax=Haloferula sp. BvORR071 TaxID=1396141 RepID=UPI002240FFB1|nr:hypothetical protein [Haloferula sp. BvORR071]